MTEPAPVEEGVPTITLNGRQWPVPPLAWKQLRKARDLIYELSEAIADPQTRGITHERFVSLTPDQYEKMGEVVYVALTRAHPTLTRDEFDDMVIGDLDLLKAFFTVRIQAGLFVAAKQDGESPPGEAAAGGSPSASTA